MLRLATKDDLELLVEMGRKFISSTGYAAYADETRMKELAEDFLTADPSQKIVLLYEDKGMLGGVVTPFLFGTVKIATEVVWWVDPDHRKSEIGMKLLEAFEFWAKKVGCGLISMVGLDDNLDKFYVRNGYRLSERAYVKEL